MLTALPIYYRFMEINAEIFDNTRLLAEGMRPAPKLTSYLELCATQPSDRSMYGLAWLLTGAAWIWFLLELVYFTDAGCPLLAFVALAGSGFALGSGWVIQTVVWLQLLRRSARFLWLSVPLAGLLGCVLL